MKKRRKVQRREEEKEEERRRRRGRTAAGDQLLVPLHDYLLIVSQASYLAPIPNISPVYS